MTLEEKLKVILATYPVGKYTIDTLEIYHSMFTKRYLFTREPEGLTAQIENGDTVNFLPTNFEPVLNSTKNDLDTVFQFTLPDPNNLLDNELEILPLDNSEPILVFYRAYISDDLSYPAEFYRLQVLNVSQEKGIFTFEAGAAQLNWKRTGEIYSYDRFPMLRAI